MTKELEKLHLNGFASVYKDFPSGTIVPFERPDFIINTNSLLLGIEHKQIFKDVESHGSSLQAQERQRLRLIKQTKEIYDNNGGPTLSAYFIFNIDRNMSSSQISGLANYFAEILISKKFNLNELSNIDFFEDSPPDQEIVHSIIVERRPVIGESNFSHVSMGWTFDIKPSRMLNEIKVKESKIDQYKMNCQEIWLLIVADDFTNATSVDLSPDAINYSYPTSFDKIFFYWHFQKHYVELNIE